MRNISIWLLMLIFFTATYGQEAELSELNNLLLPSPTPFEMTKYGNVTVNESSGKIAPSIPIHDFTAGKLLIPFVLNYSGNGVKVDQSCSWTGINWNLSAGGAITRSVRDRPDDALTPNQILYTYDEIYAMDFSTGSDDSYLFNQHAQSKSFDSQVDLFNFSFPGYSGSFYLNEQLQPVLTNYESELDIRINGNSRPIDGFVIRDPAGVAYYFGGSNNYEETMYAPGSNYQYQARTTYYLTSIVHPLGDVVTLAYSSEPDYALQIGQNQQIGKKYGTAQYCGELDIPNINPEATTKIMNTIKNGKFLSSISHNNSSASVSFSSTGYTGREYRRVLNKITINDAHGRAFKEVDLKYLDLSDDQRFFLTEVSFDETNNNTSIPKDINQKYSYRMEYNAPQDLPDRWSFAQDHLGYYNGKDGNASLIPKNSHSYFSTLNNLLGDREPSFAHATKGALTKIIYPTGGYTTFEYEAPKVLLDDADLERKFLRAYCTQYNRTPVDDLIDEVTLGYLDENGDQILVPVDQEIEVNVDVDVIDLTGTVNVNQYYIVYVRCYDYTPNNPKVIEQSFNLAWQQYDYNKKFYFSLKKGINYKIEIEINVDDIGGTPPAPMYVNAYFDYLKGDKIVDGLGIRAKKISDYSYATSEPSITRYYYTKARYANSITNDPIPKPNWSSYLSGVTVNKICSHLGILNGQATMLSVQDSYSLEYLNSSTTKSIYSTNYDYWLYSNVTISYGGDYFENGGIQKSFYKASRSGYYYFMLDPEAAGDFDNKTNSDLYDGKTLKEIYFKNQDGTLYKTKEVDYDYSIQERSKVTNMILERKFDVANVLDNIQETSLNSVKGLFLGLFDTYSKTINLSSKSTIDYIGLVPIDSYSSADQKVTSMQEYSYGAYVGLPTSIISSTSDGSIVNLSKNYYVNQAYALNGLNSRNRSNYLLLQNNHIISTPIQTETYSREFLPNNTTSDQLLSTQRILYNNILLPDTILISTGNSPLEARYNLSYHNGSKKTKEVSKISDITTSYIWGYHNQQPIVKIENLAYDVANSLLGSLIQEAIALSNADQNQTSEATLQAKLDELRIALNANFSNILVTTYTYDLPYGISGLTDSSGKTTKYVYDNFGRLLRILDQDLKVLQQFEYNYAD